MSCSGRMTAIALLAAFTVGFLAAAAHDQPRIGLVLLAVVAFLMLLISVREELDVWRPVGPRAIERELRRMIARGELDVHPDDAAKPFQHRRIRLHRDAR